MSAVEYTFSNNLVVDPQKCVFCGDCAERCPLDNIRVELALCRQRCPIDQNCHAYIQQMLRGQEDKAMGTILETSPLPRVLGRICSHPCESVCHRTQVDGQPVAIRALKRFLADNQSRPEPEQLQEEKDERVAVVGSGPSGLMAAWELRRMGYGVRIYEKAAKPGGNLTGVIPDFRLSPEVVTDEIAWIESWGIEIQTDIEVGRDISVEQMFGESHAILLATGANQPLHLGLAGEEAPNVHVALAFLKAAKEKEFPDLGHSALVIGGGNSAIDAAQTAKRLGVEDVRIVCLERREEMPAYPWQVKQALEEGVILEVGWGPSSFELKKGMARSMTCDRCISVWKDGKFSPVLDGDTQKRFYADSFIVAVGGRPDGEFLNRLGVSPSSEAEQSFDPLTLETKIKGLFAAGDLTTGPTSVVEAMASGRRAAISIDRYLRGEDLRYGRRDVGPYLFDFALNLQGASDASRQPIPALPPAERSGFEEIELAMDKASAKREAGRCLSCGLPVAYFDACWYCLPCEVSCPEEALRVEIPYIIR